MQLIQRMEALSAKHATVNIATTLAIVFCLEDARITETRDTFFDEALLAKEKLNVFVGCVVTPTLKQWNQNAETTVLQHLLGHNNTCFRKICRIFTNQNQVY